MRILITNDDGIEAPGLRALEHIAGEVSKDVWVVAPETNNSGASHSLTLAEPLRMRKLSERHYAVKGTPTDCVIMGVRFLMKDHPPDLIMCGVNQGQNLADDVSYSGTVAGAGSTEIDQGGGKPKWETPMQHGASLVRRLVEAGWPKGVLLNVNFPDCEPDAVKGSVATVQGQRDPDMLRVDDRIDTRGRAYYWLGIQRRNSKPEKGTDIWAVRSNLISVTPLCLDLTDRKVVASLEPVLGTQGSRLEHSQALRTSDAD